MADKTFNLDYDRTRMSADQTLMSWMRTSVSMIGFGFTIFQFFVFLQKSGYVVGTFDMRGPRNFGLVLVGLGTLLITLAISEHFLYLRSLNKRMGQPLQPSTALVASLIIIIMGILVLLSLLFNIGPL
jgi:putative membrane protein